MSRPSIIVPVLAILCAPAVAVAQEAAGPATGLAVEARLETADVLIDDDFTLSGTDAGLYIGYQMPRLSVGVGLDLGRIHQAQSFEGQDESMTTTTYLVMPGVRVPLVRSADGRTELLASADLGIGRSTRSTSDDTQDFEPVSRLRVQAAPAIRHWLSPSFALGASAGIRYDRMSVDSEGVDASFSNTSLYSSLNVTGVF